MSITCYIGFHDTDPADEKSVAKKDKKNPSKWIAYSVNVCKSCGKTIEKKS